MLIPVLNHKAIRHLHQLEKHDIRRSCQVQVMLAEEPKKLPLHIL